MIKAIINSFRKQPRRIDDLDRGVKALIETSMYIAPEKRFKAIKVFVETLFKDYRVYRYHPCTRKPKEAKEAA